MRYNVTMALSLLTGWAARGSAAIYTLFAFPLILTTVGADKFGIFLYAINFPSWFVLAMLGAQGTPAYYLSRSHRKGSSILFRARLGTTLLLPIVLLVSSSIVASVMIVASWWGREVADPNLAVQMKWAILLSIWLNGLLVFGGTLESFALGLGRVHVFNLVRIGALTVSLIGLFMLSGLTRDVPWYVAIHFIPQIVFLYVFGVKMVKQSDALPIFRVRFLRYIRSRNILRTAGGFFLMSLPFVVNVQLGAAVVGLLYPPERLALLLVLLRILIFAAAFFGAITATAWPQIGRDYVSGDGASFRRRSLQLIGVCSAIAGMAFLSTFTIGHPAMKLWLPDLVRDESVTLIRIFGVYLALYLWNTLWLAILAATGRVMVAGWLSAIEATLGFSLALWLFTLYEAPGYLVGLIVGCLLSTSTLAPIWGLRMIRSGSRGLRLDKKSAAAA